jgi:hypothetical protein
MERVRPQECIVVNQGVGGDNRRRNSWLAVGSVLLAGLLLVVVTGGQRSTSARLDVSTPTTLLSNANAAMKSLHSVALKQIDFASDAIAGDAKLALKQSLQFNQFKNAAAMPTAIALESARMSELKAIPISLAQESDDSDPPPTAEDMRLDHELSSIANKYDREVGTVNFGKTLENIEPSAWNAGDERQDP